MYSLFWILLVVEVVVLVNFFEARSHSAYQADTEFSIYSILPLNLQQSFCIKLIHPIITGTHP